MVLTIVKLESLLDIRPDRIEAWAKRMGLDFVTNEEAEGYFKVTIKHIMIYHKEKE